MPTSIPASSLPGNKGNPAVMGPSTSAPPPANVQQVNGQNFIPRNSTTGAADYSGTSTTTQTKPAPAVFSAKPAQDFTNNVMIPAMNNGLGAITTQNDKNAQNDLTHFLPGETADQYNQRAASVKGPSQAATAAPAKTPADTAAETIANTPETGHQFIYDPSGQRLEVPIGTPPPAGYSTTQPANPTLKGHTVVSQFNDENGTTFQQYSDGSYGTASLDGTYAGSVSADQFTKAQSTSPEAVLKSIQTGLATLKNGPLPLSQPQQAQIDALNTNLASAVKAQTDANANFTGGTTVAMNLYGMGNSVSGLGIIKGTVDSGIAKIFDLQTKAAGAIAQMQEAFNKDNLDQMYQYYSAYSAATKAIDDHITAMHTFAFQQKEHADTEADNLRTFNQKVQQDAITNKREDALAKSTLATQALDRQKTALDIAALKDANKLLEGLPGGSTLGANGQPDPAKQTAFLQTIAKSNPGMALQVKAASEYRIPLTTRFFSTKAGQAFTQIMLQYDPTWDATNYAAKQATVTNFASGKYSQTVNALNTATAHISVLEQQFATVDNTDLQGANVVRNAVKNAIGYKPTSGAKLAIAGVTGELASAFKSSGATDQEIKALGTIDQNSSPAAVKAYVTAATGLLAGKLGALNDTYTAGVGKAPPAPLLHPEAAAALSQLKNQGYNITVPGVIFTDPTAFQKADPQASQKMDAARALLIQNGLPPTPENILQAAQLANQ